MQFFKKRLCNRFVREEDVRAAKTNTDWKTSALKNTMVPRDHFYQEALSDSPEGIKTKCLKVKIK